MKKILYYFPFNPIEKNDGSKTRAFELLKFFKENDYLVDFVYEKTRNIDQNLHQKLIDSGFVEQALSITRRPQKTSLKYLVYKIHKLFQAKTSLSNYFFRKDFEKIAKKSEYDFVIISYALYSDLIKNRTLFKNSKTIVDTHDFLTIQFKNKQKHIGENFQNELEQLKKFDEVWAISFDEYTLFSHFLTSVKYVPFCLDVENLSLEKSKVYDLIYIASENHHNVTAAKWFFENVYTQLDKKISILVIGKIGNHIQNQENITKILFAQDLSNYYSTSKISICPMLSGSGVKIKVIEALSFGLPIVTSIRGVDGLPNKTNNGCLVSNNAVEFAENINQLLTDDKFYQEKSIEAKSFFESQFSKVKFTKIMKNLLKT
jgi:glycosyltransferase involved in cell wall biosynthesis